MAFTLAITAYFKIINPRQMKSAALRPMKM